jgi:hypothetical protein
LKFIEITKEDKDILSLDIKFEGNSTKTEFFKSITFLVNTDVTKVVENEFKLIAIKSYDPKIWGYHAIEPLSELKRFKAKE